MHAYLTTGHIAAETSQKLLSKDHVVVHRGVHSWASRTLDMPIETDHPMRKHLAVELAWASR